MKFVKQHTPTLILSNLFSIKLIIVFLFFIGKVYAHGSLSIRIAEKTEEISKDPKNAKLFFERGFLFEQHYEYKKAINDFLKSKKLGNTSIELHYYLSESYYYNTNYKKALKQVSSILKNETLSLKVSKLQAQILFKLKRYQEAKGVYTNVIKNSLEIHPEEIIEYTTIILAVDNTNFQEAINAIDIGLQKIGEHILTLQLKKLEYLIASSQRTKVIEQYNYFILQNKRNEFWYYKKAKYLAKINKPQEAIIALHQSKVTITALKPKIQNTSAVKQLITQIIEFEQTLPL